MLSVQQNSVKYYKYDLQNATGIKTLFLETTYGRGDFLVSMWDKNPRSYHLNLGLCKSNQGNKRANQSNVFELEVLEGSDFCNVNEDGGCTEPRVVSDTEFKEEGMIVYVRKCSSRWFYVSVEGINKTNTFNLTLFKDFIRSRTANTPESPLEVGISYVLKFSRTFLKFFAFGIYNDYGKVPSKSSSNENCVNIEVNCITCTAENSLLRLQIKIFLYFQRH